MLTSINAEPSVLLLGGNTCICISITTAEEEGGAYHKVILNFRMSSLLVSKAIGTLIILGSIIVKIPQILSVYEAKSVAGLSEASLYLDVPLVLSFCVYNYSIGTELVQYGEYISLLFQNIILVGMTFVYSKEKKTLFDVMLSIFGFVMCVFICFTIPPNMLNGVQFTLMLATRFPQLYKNYIDKSTGTLSIITTGLNFLGGLGRVITTINVTEENVQIDTGILFLNLLGVFITFLIIIQIIVYKPDKKAMKKSE